MKKTLLITFIFIVSFSFGQTFNQYYKAGDKAFKKGEYFSAISYLKKAALFKKNIDDVIFLIGQSYLELKDYEMSLKHFKRVRKKSSYPLLSYKIANSLVLIGDYNQAIKYYEGFQNNYKENDFYTKNTSQKIASCYWAIDHNKLKEVKIEAFDKEINTQFSEFSASYFKDSVIQLTSFAQDEENKRNDYKSDLLFYQKVANNFQTIEVNIPNNKKLQSANGFYLEQKKRFYFNQCESTKNGKKRCDLYVTEFKDGIWSEPLFLNINKKNSTTTQANVYVNNKGKDVLFFVSDRENGAGKNDIWTATETEFGIFDSPKCLVINTIEDEASPFFDTQNNTLYFSSKWYYGFGGFDIFSSQEMHGSFSSPKNIGLPYNSSANDLYFNINEKEEGLLSSNRTGAMKLRGVSCCYDIFKFEKDLKPKAIEKDTVSEIDSIIVVHKIDSAEIILTKIREMLPITVYFHNDEPNPKTETITTSLNYTDNYNSFKNQKDEYYKMNVFDEIDAFFYDYLEKGFTDLKAFNRLLEKIVPDNKIKLEIKGYCSPLAKNDYNINLSKRRIASLKNELNENEVLSNAISNNKLIIVDIPFGEEKANPTVSDDYYNVKQSIFSVGASKERKVSIIGIFVE